MAINLIPLERGENEKRTIGKEMKMRNPIATFRIATNSKPRGNFISYEFGPLSKK